MPRRPVSHSDKEYGLSRPRPCTLGRLSACISWHGICASVLGLNPGTPAHARIDASWDDLVPAQRRQLQDIRRWQSQKSFTNYIPHPIFDVMVTACCMALGTCILNGELDHETVLCCSLLTGIPGDFMRRGMAEQGLLAQEDGQTAQERVSENNATGHPDRPKEASVVLSHKSKRDRLPSGLPGGLTSDGAAVISGRTFSLPTRSTNSRCAWSNGAIF